MASRYFASPSESEAAIKPLYNTLQVQIRSKYSCDRASCQSPTFRIALPTAAGSSEAERSVAIGPPSSGSSPKCRALSFAIPANCCGVACSYDTCCALAVTPDPASSTDKATPCFHPQPITLVSPP